MAATTTSKSKEYVIRLGMIEDERRATSPSMCKVHFIKQPMKIAKASKQYLYDDLGYEFLDCCGNIAHVGHCHPHIVHSGQKQMSTLATAQGFVTEAQSSYGKMLLETVDDPKLDTVLLVNSGSEAVDLSVRLAQSFTRRKHILNHQPAVHGHSGVLTSMHYKYIKNGDFKPASYVHHIPICDTYRGPYSLSENPVKEAVTALRDLLKTLATNNQPICGLLTETVHTAAGNIVPPDGYLREVTQAVREFGGLLILDEVLTGLGRHDTNWWSFQKHSITPDILVCGRCLGNGQPLAAVITSSAIANSIPEYANSFGGNPVSCAMGKAVIEVIRNEHLLTSSSVVSRDLRNGLKKLVDKHPNVGQVRGLGLSIVLDIVTDKTSRKPSKELAEKITYRLREQYRTLVPADGPDGNCLFITPPMCFSMENSRTLTQNIDNALYDVENGRTDPVKSLFELGDEFNIPRDIIAGKRKGGSIADALAGKQARLEPEWNDGID